MKTPSCIALLALLIFPQPTSAQQQSNVAATVNGEVITMEEWIKRMERLRAQDFLASANPLRFKQTTGGRIALESLINTRLLLQYAARTSLLPTDKDVENQLNIAKQDPRIKAALDSGELSEAQLKEDLRLQRTVYNVATINQQITPEEVRAYYERNFIPTERWKLGVIRISNKETLEKALAELRKGTPFATVASQYSEDEATRANGGEIGPVSVNDRALDPIREAVKKLQIGEVTPPIEVQAPPGPGGTARKVTFIVRLIGREQPKARPFEEVKALVEQQALFEKVGGMAAAEKKIAEFRKTAKITIHLPGYKDLAGN